MPEFIDKPGLSNLTDVELDEFHLGLYENAVENCPGTGHYQKRMLAEYREALAMGQTSGKIKPLGVTFEGVFQLQFILQTPVPTKDEEGEMKILDWAHVHLAYPENAVFQPSKGTDFVRIMIPPNIFHPNVSHSIPGLPIQALCLGTTIPAGIRVRELILMIYGALSLQSVQMDIFDPAGLLNPEAAEWWQINRERIPLTREPFFNL